MSATTIWRATTNPLAQKRMDGALLDLISKGLTRDAILFLYYRLHIMVVGEKTFKVWGDRDCKRIVLRVFLHTAKLALTILSVNRHETPQTGYCVFFFFFEF